MALCNFVLGGLVNGEVGKAYIWEAYKRSEDTLRNELKLTCRYI